jgi:hypothetical protein
VQIGRPCCLSWRTFSKFLRRFQLRTGGRASLSYLIAPILSAVFVGGCSVGSRHLSDRTLEENFSRHEAQFEALRADFVADPKMMTIGNDGLLYAGKFVKFTTGEFSEAERAGVSTQRWALYRKTLGELRLPGGVLRGDKCIEFRAESGSIFNGDSYKGYVYSEVQPFPVRKILDDYKTSFADKDSFGNVKVYKLIKAHWYLYIFVNG